MRSPSHRGRGTLLALIASAALGSCDTEATGPFTDATIEIAPASLVLDVGSHTSLTATLTRADGAAPGSDPDYRWTTEASDVAVVSDEGVVTATGAGSTRIRATTGGASASIELRVRAETDPIRVTPGADIQAIVNAQPAGATFLFGSGVYEELEIVPRAGNVFRGEEGAILDGRGSASYAFAFGGRYPDDVTIEDLTIRGYDPASQMGAIRGGDHAGRRQTSGWTLRNLDVHSNDGAGVRVGDRMQILDSHIHDNLQIGVVGIGDDVRIEGNEIRANNPGRDYDILFEAGGIKIVGSERPVIRDNLVRDNVGMGIWLDIDVHDAVIEDNDVFANGASGIVFEISRGAVIRGNDVEGNGTVYGTWLHGAGILIQNSEEVLVVDNRVAWNANGVTIMDQNRGSGPDGPYRARDIVVTGNRISMNEGVTGAATDRDAAYLFQPGAIVFDDNTYQFPGGPFFEWAGRRISWNDWLESGQDPLSVWN